MLLMCTQHALSSYLITWESVESPLCSSACSLSRILHYCRPASCRWVNERFWSLSLFAVVGLPISGNWLFCCVDGRTKSAGICRHQLLQINTSESIPWPTCEQSLPKKPKIALPLLIEFFSELELESLNLLLCLSLEAGSPPDRKIGQPEVSYTIWPEPNHYSSTVVGIPVYLRAWEDPKGGM